MRVPGRTHKEEGQAPNGRPKKISQRWVIILLAAVVGWWMVKLAITEAMAGMIAEGVATEVALGAQTVGITTALGIIRLLHKIME